jgi:hypothetical protein
MMLQVEREREGEAAGVAGADVHDALGLHRGHRPDRAYFGASAMTRSVSRPPLASVASA